MYVVPARHVPTTAKFLACDSSDATAAFSAAFSAFSSAISDFSGAMLPSKFEKKRNVAKSAWIRRRGYRGGDQPLHLLTIIGLENTAGETCLSGTLLNARPAGYRVYRCVS